MGVWKSVSDFLYPENSPVVSEKTNKVTVAAKPKPKPEPDKALKDSLRGNVQRSRMDDAIRNAGG